MGTLQPRGANMKSLAWGPLLWALFASTGCGAKQPHSAGKGAELNREGANKPIAGPFAEFQGTWEPKQQQKPTAEKVRLVIDSDGQGRFLLWIDATKSFVRGFREGYQ